MEIVLNKIKDLRKKKGLSHEYMAQRLAISQAAYSKLEKNETVLSVDRLFKIAEILEANLNDILEINPNNVYHQDLKDNAVGHQQVHTLHQENKEIYERLIASKENEITLLKELLNKK